MPRRQRKQALAEGGTGELREAGAAARAKTERRRAAQPLWTALDTHLGPHVARGLVLAVSGGPDSRALLEAVARWPRRADGAVHVACVDHETRASSRAEAEAVVARARVLGIDGAVLSLRASSGAAGAATTATTGDEAALRAARYRALAAHAVSLGAGAVVVAHHGGDVAEGALMSWLGQGGSGAAMPAERALAADVVVVRPFLALPRAALREGLWGLGVRDVVVDPEARSLRARLRADTLGPLGAGRADVEAALARAARRRRDDEDALAAAAALLVTTTGGGPDGAPDLLVRDGPPALVRRALRDALARVAGGRDLRASSPALDLVVELLRRGTPGEVHLRGAVATVLRRASGAGGTGVAATEMAVGIRAQARTVADGTAPTHDGQGTRLSEAHPLVTLPARRSRFPRLEE